MILFLFYSVLACNSGDKFINAKQKNEADQSNVSPQETENDLEEGRNLQANEPVPIGGSFLSCHYQANQQQNSPQLILQCQLKDVPPFEAESVEASFHKLDAEGTRYELKVTNQDLGTFSWTLAENSETSYMTSIEANITVNGHEKFTFKAVIQSPIKINLVLDYWINGEPNNGINSTADEENCILFRNLFDQQRRATNSGVPAGPLERLDDISCSLTRNFLCRSFIPTLSPKWLISDRVDVFNNYADACPANYKFGMPMTDQEFGEVIAVIDEYESETNFQVWVPMHDREVEGEFHIMIH
ncbi:MAG: hypothetical protein ACOH5I_20965 [Oligoflexus sp.]